MNSRWNENLIIFVGSKLGFLGPLGIDFRSNLLKFSEKLEFDVKIWKILFCEAFDLVRPLVKLRVDWGHSGHFC